MFGEPGTRKKCKQTTELTAMFATDMHVTWLAGFLFYRVLTGEVNLPRLAK